MCLRYQLHTEEEEKVNLLDNLGASSKPLDSPAHDLNAEEVAPPRPSTLKFESSSSPTEEYGTSIKRKEKTCLAKCFPCCFAGETTSEEETKWVMILSDPHTQNCLQFIKHLCHSSWWAQGHRQTVLFGSLFVLLKVVLSRSTSFKPLNFQMPEWGESWNIPALIVE